MTGQFFQTLLTGKDDKSFDIAHVLWGGCVVVLCAMESHSVAYLHQTFDPMELAKGAAMMLAAGGVGVAVKSHTEPDPQ